MFSLVIKDTNGNTAILSCKDYNDALKTKIAFENYGKYPYLKIVKK